MAKKKSLKISNQAKEKIWFLLKKCDECNYTTVTLSNLTKHILKIHPIPIESDKSVNNSNKTNIHHARVEDNDESTTILLNKLKDHVGNNTTITLTNVNSSDQKTHPVTTDSDAILNKLKNHVQSDTIVTPCNLDKNVPNVNSGTNEIDKSPMNEDKDDATNDDPARIEDFAESTTLMLTNLKDDVRNVTIGTNEIPPKNLETEKFEDYLNAKQNVSEDEEVSLAEIASKNGISMPPECEPTNFNQMESTLDSDDDTEAEDDLPFETKLKLANDEEERRSFVNDISENNSNFLNEENSEASQNAGTNAIAKLQKWMPRLKKNLMEIKQNDSLEMKTSERPNGANSSSYFPNFNIARAWSRN